MIEKIFPWRRKEEHTIADILYTSITSKKFYSWAGPMVSFENRMFISVSTEEENAIMTKRESLEDTRIVNSFTFHFLMKCTDEMRNYYAIAVSGGKESKIKKGDLYTELLRRRIHPKTAEEIEKIARNMKLEYTRQETVFMDGEKIDQITRCPERYVLRVYTTENEFHIFMLARRSP